MPSHEDFEIPKSWPAADLKNWIDATLDEAGVTSIEFFDQGTKYLVRVHYAT